MQAAIKLFDKKAITTDYLVQNLHREGLLLRRLSHPNIIKLYEIIETEDLYCLVMEHAHLDVLTRLCTEGPIAKEAEVRLSRRPV